jgi:periplasmic protein CpxP/Spy
MLTVAGATIAFSTIGFAQSTPTTTAPADPAATQKVDGHWGKGQGKRGGFEGKHAGMGHGRGMGMMFHDLDLTDAQKAQIKTIMEANKPAGDNREEMKSLRAAKQAGTLTDAQKQQLKSIREDRQLKAKSIHEQIMAVLTPEQKAKIEARHAEMKARMQERKLNHQQQAPAAATDKPSN